MFYSPLAAFLYRLKHPFSELISTVGFIRDRSQPRSQGLSSSRPLSLSLSLQGGVKKRDPGNDVGSIKALVVIVKDFFKLL